MSKTGLPVIFPLFAILAGVMFAGTAAAAVDPGKVVGGSHADDLEKRTVINRVIDKSGMGTAIEQLPELVAAGMEQQPPPPGLEGERLERFKTGFLKAFEPGEVRKAVFDHLSNYYDSKRFSELLALLDKPLVRKMTALEKEAGTPQAQREMMEMGKMLLEGTSPARLEFVKKIDQATGATRTAVETQIMMIHAMMVGSNQMVAAEERISDDEIERRLKQIRTQFVAPAEQYTQIAMLYTYQSVDGEELRDYLGLYQTGIGRWSVELLQGAWKRASEHIASRLADGLGSSGRP